MTKNILNNLLARFHRISSYWKYNPDFPTGPLFLKNDDNVPVRWGTDEDFEILHDGVDSIIRNRKQDSDTVFYNNVGGTDTEVMRVHGDSGIVDLPEQSGCRVYISADQTIADSTITKIEFNSENYDTQNEFDSTTNNRFTVTKAGYYLISVSVNWKGSVAGSLHDIRVKKNGNDIIYKSMYSPTTDSFSIIASSVVYLLASDYVDAYVYQSTGVSQDLRGGASGQIYTYMNIQKLA